MSSQIEPVPDYTTTNTLFVVVDPNSPHHTLVHGQRLMDVDDPHGTTWRLTPRFKHQRWNDEWQRHHAKSISVIGEDQARDVANEVAQIVAEIDAKTETHLSEMEVFFDKLGDVTPS